MSKIFVDNVQQGSTFSSGSNLTSLLSGINLKCTSSNVPNVRIQLTEPGEYYITTRLFVHCNFTLEGCEGARIVANFPNQQACLDDCFIHLTNYNSTNNQYRRCDYAIKDVEFGVHSNHFWKKQEDGVTEAELHYLKVYACGSLHFDNVKMRLEGHPISNIDIRCGENILIENCLLENYHDNSTEINKVGGNLWLRAILQNVKIVNNIFKKTGNDEALGFFAHHSQGNNILPSDEIPADGICRKENILVENNIIEYGEPGTPETSISNDCLISLIDLGSSQSQTLKHHYENIVFNGNTIIINDLVKRVFFCMNKEETTIRDVIFVNNKININGFTANSTTCQLFECHNVSSDVDSVYQVIGNKVYNKAKIINGSSPGLYFILQNGGTVSVLDNVVRIFEDGNDSDQKFRQFNLFWINKRISKISVVGNDLEGTYLLGAISTSTTSGEEAISKADVLIKNNVIKGDAEIFNRNVGELNLSMEDNYIESVKYVIAIQEYGSSGKFSYTNNHVISRFSGSPSFYYTGSGSCNASRVCIANNVFENCTGSILTTLHNYTSSSIRTEVNNIYLN